MKIMDEGRNLYWTYSVIFLGEFSGIAFLMFFGCMGLLTEVTSSHSLPDLQAALVWGTTITAVIMVINILYSTTI